MNETFELKPLFLLVLEAFKKADELITFKSEFINIISEEKIYIKDICINFGLCLSVHRFSTNYNMVLFIKIIYKNRPKKMWKNTGWFWDPHDLKSRIKLLEFIIENEF